MNTTPQKTRTYKRKRKPPSRKDFLVKKVTQKKERRSEPETPQKKEEKKQPETRKKEDTPTKTRSLKERLWEPSQEPSQGPSPPEESCQGFPIKEEQCILEAAKRENPPKDRCSEAEVQQKEEEESQPKGKKDLKDVLRPLKRPNKRYLSIPIILII
jgi:hypothetical protein